MDAGPKTRLDQFLAETGRYPSRSRAADAVRRGCVRVNGVAAVRAGLGVGPADRIDIDDGASGYVSRAALKLKAGLDATGYSPAGRHCLDIGASTGGFTQVLLEAGASLVTAVDVGHGQMDGRLAADARVRRLDGVNARELGRDHIGAEPVGFLVSDVSFISLRLALAPALELAAPGAFGIFLVKPQFEVGREHVGRGGIVRDGDLARRAARGVADWIASRPGWRIAHFLDSPIEGGDGNREFLAAGTRSA